MFISCIQMLTAYYVIIYTLILSLYNRMNQLNQTDSIISVSFDEQFVAYVAHLVSSSKIQG